LGVSRSGYYDWRTRQPSKRIIRDRYLTAEIREIHKASGENYGTIKTWEALRTKGIVCGRHHVARLRRVHGIESKRRKRFKVTTVSKNTEWIAPNWLNRHFRISRPNKVWVGDITFIATRNRMVICGGAAGFVFKEGDWLVHVGEEQQRTGS
jgi:transposase InsO family protein